jgi:integrase
MSVKSRLHGGSAYLLDRNPLKGTPFPKEPTPRRPVIADDQYQSLLKASEQVGPLYRTALILAHETGHRIGSIRLLRWSDVDLERGTIRWRAENDKIAYEHQTILTAEGVSALEQLRQVEPGIGDTWVFPAPGTPREPCSRHLMRD